MSLRFMSPTMLLDALDLDTHRDHADSLVHGDFEGDGEALYLDVDGYFDEADDFQEPDRAIRAVQLGS